MDPMTSKDDWRSWARQIDRSGSTSAIADVLTKWPPLNGTVLSYLAMSDEVGLEAVHRLPRCKVVLTRTPDAGNLTVHEYDPGRLEAHTFGFDQPRADAATVTFDEIDVVLVPGLVFDKAGHRIGRGGGYYDRLLASLPPGVIRIGITTDETFVEEVTTESHDQRVAWVATESGVHRVGDPLSPATTRFVEQAVLRGVAPDIYMFPDGTRTSADAATAVGAELGEIAKSILFDVDGRSVLVICSGDRRIDETKLAETCDADRASIADRDAVKQITGYVVGGTPAVGLSEDIRVLADVDLLRYRWVWSAGGSPDTVYPVALDRLIAASGARWAKIT